MLGSEAVTRINEGLGFRPAGNSLEATILLRLKEAQRDLEKGKTLPRFLLQEDQTLSLVAGTSTVALPTGFLRESDETRIRFFPPTSEVPTFLERKYYIDAVMANMHATSASDLTVEAVAPSVYVIRKATIDFITEADITYTLYWDYYKADAIITLGAENEWLEHASDWLIGFAGRRLCRSLRNASGVELFAEMEREGRAAVFGDDIALEQASGPLQMGANL